MRTYKYIIINILIIISIAISSPNGIESINEVGEGSFLFKSEDNEELYQFLPQLDTKVTINIKGMVSNTVVDQMFTNNTDKPIEAVYVFPLPSKAAVNNMQMIVDDRIIQGNIKKKAEAKKEYQQAKKEGKRASLTEQKRDNIFTNNVANIMPGDTIVVRLEYVDDINFENGKFNTRFPMVVAPRFIPGNTVTGYSGTGWSYDTDIVPDASEITPPVMPDGMRTGNSILIDINIDAGIELDEVKSSSHEIIVNKLNQSNYKVNLKREDYIPNKDFVIDYKVKQGHEPKAALFINTISDEENIKQDNYFMLMVVPPVENSEKINIGKEIIFIIDVSGSMQGTSINQAKQSLLYSINRLNQGDSFNIIAFNSSYTYLSETPLIYNEESSEKAIRFINNLNANGGTLPAPALKYAMNMKEDISKVKMLIFMTDGAIGNELDIINLIDNNLKNARLFGVGIGSAPNSYLLEKVCEKGRGTYTYINSVNNVNEKMKDLLHKIDMPVLTDIKLYMPGNNEILPNPLPDLFINEPLVAFGKVENPNNVDIKISGKNIDGNFNLTMPISFSNGTQNSAIGDIWARRKIDKIMDEYNLAYNDLERKNIAKNNIIYLSLKHNLLTKFTSFVAVENKIVNPSGNSIVAAIPTDLPEGWNYNSVFGPNNIVNKKDMQPYNKMNSNFENHTYAQNKMPVTGRSLGIEILLGIVSLFICSVLFIINKRLFFEKK